MNDGQRRVTAQQAMNVFVKAGRPDLADGMGKQLRAQAQILLGVADEKRNMGDVRGAVQTLLEALHMAPGNLQVMIAVVAGSSGRSWRWAGITRWPGCARAAGAYPGAGSGASAPEGAG
jgi:hypothetical protein